MCASLLSLKCSALSPDMVEQDAAGLVHNAGRTHPDGDGLPSPGRSSGSSTPGHSVGHISTVTPDGGCYVGTLFQGAAGCQAALLPIPPDGDGEPGEKLRGLDCEQLIMAHRGSPGGEELDGLIDANQALALRRAGEILALIDRPMAASDIVRRVCLFYKLLSSSPRRALRFEREHPLFIEFLVDRGTWSWRRRTASRSTARPLRRWKRLSMRLNCSLLRRGAVFKSVKKCLTYRTGCLS